MLQTVHTYLLFHVILPDEKKCFFEHLQKTNDDVKTKTKKNEYGMVDKPKTKKNTDTILFSCLQCLCMSCFTTLKNDCHQTSQVLNY